MKRFILSAAMLLLALASFAQEMQAPQMPQIPKDPAIRYGVLPNGLTYYVRHNEEPKGQAEFYIAQKVGSMQEEDNQLGLAHFLEHMCFNGTKNFPGKGVINYLQTIGVEFGRNLNAYTSFDQTVYNISSVPVSREGIIDSCLLILHDWSNALALEDKEIDAERGVIHEEWRTENAMLRMYTAILPQIYPGCRYGNRMPIGTMDVIDNFPYQLLRDYYHTWYRPDLQAVLVVGDIDADKIVEKIKATFADIEKPKKAKKREYEKVKDNKEPIVAIVNDKEQTINNLMLMWKSDVLETEQKNTPLFFMSKFMESAISQMLNTRIAELMQKSDPPFIHARLSFGEFLVSKTKDASTLSVVYADGGLDKALTAALTELLRATRHGFTVSEYMRFYEEYMRNYEQYYTERDKRTSNAYVEEYVRNFLDNEPIPGVELEYQLISQIAPSIPLDVINQVAKEIVTDDKFVIALMNTATEQPATREHLLELVQQVKDSQIEAYVDEVIDRPLLAEIPNKGKIVKEEPGVFGSTVLTLNNGVRVIMRSTDFQADEIQITGFRKGGTSLFEDADVEQAQWIDALHGVMGMGDFSAIDLQKALAGKHVSADVSLNAVGENVSGSCSVRDLETLLQLGTLSFAPQRIDDEAFKSFCKRQRLALENQEADPMKAFRDTLLTTLAPNPARLVLMKPELIDRIDVNKVKAMYDSRFDHADGFTFVVVGNLDNDSCKNLLVQYLGSLPVKGVNDEPVKRNEAFRAGVYQSKFQRKMEMDRSTVFMNWVGHAEFNMKNDIIMDVLSQALQNALLNSMREEAGATYSPAVQCSLSPNNFGDEANVIVFFQTNPEMRDKLIEMANVEMERVQKEGVSEEEIAKARQLLIKNYKENQRKNDAMSAYLTTYYKYGKDCNTGYLEAVLSVTNDDIINLARKLFEQNNKAVIAISPEGK